MRLAGKTLLITGSTTGIGEATARLCTRQGATVMVHGRDRERAEAVATALGPQAAFHVDDLADPEAPARLVQATVQRFGRLDGVVNNAALTTRSNLATTDTAMFDTMMAVNLRAPMLIVRAAVDHLKASRGVILNIGSWNAYCGEPDLLAYSMSKGGLMTMSRNLADTLGRDGVRVIHFNVGWVLTPNEYTLKQRDGLGPDWPKQLPASVAPSGTILTPEQIAAVAAFWLGDESGPISGTVLELEQYPVIGRNPQKEPT